MEPKTATSTIKVQQYKFGQPFPGLYGQFENLERLPLSAQIKRRGAMGDYYLQQGGMTAKFGVVFTAAHGFLLVQDGEYMQVSGADPGEGYQLASCIGRVPEGYTVEK